MSGQKSTDNGLKSVISISIISSINNGIVMPVHINERGYGSIEIKKTDFRGKWTKKAA